MARYLDEPLEMKELKNGMTSHKIIDRVLPGEMVETGFGNYFAAPRQYGTYSVWAVCFKNGEYSHMDFEKDSDEVDLSIVPPAKRDEVILIKALDDILRHQNKKTGNLLDDIDSLAYFVRGMVIEDDLYMDEVRYMTDTIKLLKASNNELYTSDPVVFDMLIDIIEKYPHYR